MGDFKQNCYAGMTKQGVAVIFATKASKKKTRSAQRFEEDRIQDFHAPLGATYL